MALVAALLGWLFDGFEMGLFPVVARPAVMELLGDQASDALFGRWYGVITAAFLVGPRRAVSYSVGWGIGSGEFAP